MLFVCVVCFHVALFRSAGLLLAELAGLQVTRQEINEKLELTGEDIDQRLVITEAAEKTLRASLRIGPSTEFRKLVIEGLLAADPRERIGVRVAYTLTQQLLRVCVAKSSVPFSEVASYRHAFWRRLQRLFGKATSMSPDGFHFQRTLDGSTMVQFRITHPSPDDVLAELQRQLSDRASVIRQDKLGKTIFSIKRWEESDGLRLSRAAVV